MTVKVALVQDNIRNNGALVPRVVKRNKVSFDKFLGYLEKTSGFSQKDLRSVFRQFAEAMAFFLADGSEVQTPIGTIKFSVHFPGINGVSPGADRGQKIGSEDMRLQIRGDRPFLDRLRLGVSLELVDAPPLLMPTVGRVENADLRGLVDSGSAGQILHITGSRLHFAREDKEQGVFFISSSASARATRMAVYSHIGSNIVDGKIPDLEAGDYRLEVRTLPSGREIRAVQHGEWITIS